VGEAKRRKQLDPNYGTVQRSVAKALEEYRESLQREHDLQSAMFKKMCQELGQQQAFCSIAISLCFRLTKGVQSRFDIDFYRQPQIMEKQYECFHKHFQGNPPAQED
jgi:hypothetical protein